MNLDLDKHLIDFDLRSYPGFVQTKYSHPINFINDEELFIQIRSLTSICPKLILAGSVSLHVLGISNFDFKVRKPDLDFALTEPLTEEEFLLLRSFFDLKSLNGGDYGMEDDNSVKVSDILKREVIFMQDPKTNRNFDIFNKDYFDKFRANQYNLYPINFGNNKEPYIVYCQHPAITISHKMKYAFCSNYGKKQKHFNDCVDLICKDYTRTMERCSFLDRMKNEFEYEFAYNFGKPKSTTNE